MLVEQVVNFLQVPLQDLLPLVFERVVDLRKLGDIIFPHLDELGSHLSDQFIDILFLLFNGFVVLVVFVF